MLKISCSFDDLTRNALQLLLKEEYDRMYAPEGRIAGCTRPGLCCSFDATLKTASKSLVCKQRLAKSHRQFGKGSRPSEAKT